MKPIRFVLVLLVVLMAGAAAEAQCLKCVPVTFQYGTCDEAYPDDYCDRGCCGEYIGKLCTFPDFRDLCFPWAEKENTSLVRLQPAPRQLRAPFFSSHQVVEHQTESLHRRLQALDPNAPRCKAGVRT